MEKSLNKDEQIFRSMFDRNDAVMLMIDPADGSIIDANKSAAEFYGYSRSKLSGMKIQQINQLEPHQINEAMLSAEKENRNYFIFPHKLASGEIRTVEVHSTPINVNGEEILFSIIHDITQRQKSRNALVESEEKYRRLVETANEGVWAMDKKFRTTFANNKMADLLGYSIDEIMGENISEFIFPDDSPDHQKRMQSRSAGLKETYERKLRHKDGRQVWTLLSATPIMDEAGQFNGSFAMLTDISDRKQIELELEQQRSHLDELVEERTVELSEANKTLRKDEKMIKKSHQRLLTVLNSLEAIVYVADMDTHEVLFANEYTLKLFGEVEGKICWQTLQKGQDGPCAFCTNKYLDDLENYPSGMYSWEVKNTITDQWLKVIDRVITWIDGRKVRLEIATDITDRKLVEEALQKAHGELEQRVEERTLELQMTHEQLLHSEKLSAIGTLSASIAHEFNNPLQGIMNILKGVARRTTLDDDDAKLMTLAVGECYRMRDLIRNLQDFNRPTSGRKAPMDIHAVLDSLLLLGKKEYSTKKIIIEKRYSENIPLIMAVADQIKQVFLNLLNNASDACSGGGTVTLETERLDHKVVVRIHDTGIGIKPEDQDHIFEPFFTTKPEIKSTGLGLSVSYGIIKKHGGEITVHSELGKGAIFLVILPIEGGHNVK